MEFVGDFHIHGRYAQACSKLTTIEDLERNARIKGIGVLGTGDMQHPLWFQELTAKLAEDENGILWTKNKFPFIWQTEISLAYTQGGKGRRIHHVVLAPNKEVVLQFRDALLKRGRIDYDGRPIFGMSSIEFVDMVRSISQDIEVIPAHAWTSWMAIFGSKSGFDSVEECFGDRAKYIHAIETGMSCYDLETEVLTNQGWKKFPELNYSNEIYTLDPKNGNIEFYKPNKIMSYDYNGKMYKLKTKRVDLFVTPNHKLLVSKCDFRKSPEFFLKEAGFLFGKSKRFKKDGLWKGKRITHFILPAVKIRHGSRFYSGFRNKDIKKLDIESWVKFFGFWLAEGWVTEGNNGDYGVYLCNTNKKLIREMTQIFKSFGYSIFYNKNLDTLRIRDYQLFSYLKPFGKCYDKFIPQEIKELSGDLLKTFLDYYIKGDGHIYGRNSMGLSATTTSIRLRDDLQEIALKLGMSAYYKLHRPKGTPFSSPSQGKIYKQRNDSWVIYFIRKNIHTVLPSTIKNNKKYIESWVDFKGKVYCVEVPNHIIYVRRNGIPVWCGNSDPPMNRRVSKLDKYQLVSFSDPHSAHPWRLGREATLFDCDLRYKGIINAIRTGEGLKGTIEVNPAYGKYHVDGHRACGVVLDPAETKRINGVCPKCKSPLTIGVAYRIEQLADRQEPKNVPYFKEVMPLTELIAAVYGIKQLASKKVWEVYNLLIKNFANEYNVLLSVALEELQKVVDPRLARVILANRENKLQINPGYDGVYGTIVLEESERAGKQKSLDQF